MIRVTVKTGSATKIDTVPKEATPANVAATFGLDCHCGALRLDGELLNADSMNKSLEELGIQDGADTMLSFVVKAEGAAR